MKSIYAAIALGLSGLAIAACSEAPVEEAAETPPIAASEGRLFLPAVEGNPGAVYFELENTSERAISVRRADVEGAARAELHDYMEYDDTEMGSIGVVTIGAGETVSFEPGAKHVMAYEISPDLQPESVTSVTLTMAGGKTMSFDVDVLPADAER